MTLYEKKELFYFILLIAIFVTGFGIGWGVCQ